MTELGTVWREIEVRGEILVAGKNGTRPDFATTALFDNKMLRSTFRSRSIGGAEIFLRDRQADRKGGEYNLAILPLRGDKTLAPSQTGIMAILFTNNTQTPEGALTEFIKQKSDFAMYWTRKTETFEDAQALAKQTIDQFAAQKDQMFDIIRDVLTVEHALDSENIQNLKALMAGIDLPEPSMVDRTSIRLLPEPVHNEVLANLFEEMGLTPDPVTPAPVAAEETPAAKTIKDRILSAVSRAAGTKPAPLNA